MVAPASSPRVNMSSPLQYVELSSPVPVPLVVGECKTATIPRADLMSQYGSALFQN